MFLQRKLTRDSVPKAFIEGWLRRQILPKMYQNSRLPEEKQMFSIYHIVYTNNLGTVSQHQSVVEWCTPSLNPRFHTPVKGQSGKQIFLRIAILDLQC